MTPAQPVGPDVEEPLPPGFNENMVALELRGLRPQTVLSLILGEKQEDEERGDGQAPVAGEVTKANRSVHRRKKALLQSSVASRNVRDECIASEVRVSSKRGTSLVCGSDAP